MSVAFTGDLQHKINQQINAYASQQGKIYNFFHPKERNFLTAYRKKVNSYSDEAELRERLLRDVLSDRSQLANFTNLRRSIAHALCKDLNISLTAIKSTADKRVTTLVKAYTRSGAAVPVDAAREYDRILLTALYNTARPILSQKALIEMETYRSNVLETQPANFKTKVAMAHNSKLHEIINAQLDNYEKYDNPTPQTTCQTVLGLFGYTSM